MIALESKPYSPLHDCHYDDIIPSASLEIFSFLFVIFQISALFSTRELLAEDTFYLHNIS